MIPLGWRCGECDEGEVTPRERIHYASDPVVLEPRVVPQHTEHKPEGLWYSAPCAEDGWEEWCRSEEYALDRLGVRHRLEIDESRVLLIRGLDELDAFHARFAVPNPHYVTVTHRWWINWAHVADTYAGIEIAPYQWDRRLSSFGGYSWYYGWDCASGCIWDASAILAFKVEDHEVPANTLRRCT